MLFSPSTASACKPPLIALIDLLVRLISILACAIPTLASARDDQSHPWSVQRVTTSTSRKIETSSSSVVSISTPWKTATSYPTNIHLYGFAQNGDDFYIISGLSDSSTTLVTAVRRYNVTTDTWTSLADVPIAAGSPPAVYYNGKIYMLAVLFPPSYPFWPPDPHWQIYDIATDTWSEGAAPPAIFDSTETYIGVFNDNIYVTGRGVLVIYNVASNSWSTGPTPPVPATGAFWDWGGGYTQVGQYLYIVGGAYFSHIFEGQFNSDLCKRLDMASNTWSVGPPWTMLRKQFALAAVGNKLIAIGGDPTGGYDSLVPGSTEVDELDTSTWPDGAWQRTPFNLPSPRVGNRAGFVSSNRVGGEVWTTGGARAPSFESPAEFLNEHLFLPTNITSSGSPIVAAGSNGVLDPGERVTVLLGVRSFAGTGFCTKGALTGKLLTSGGVTSPSGPQNYGVICDSTFRRFTFTVDPSLPCGSDVTVSLAMADGATDYGTITYVFATGNQAPIFAENFDEVEAPSLPPGWAASNDSGATLWTTSAQDADTLANAAFVGATQSETSDKRLDTPAMVISSPYTKVIFRHNYDLRYRI